MHSVIRKVVAGAVLGGVMLLGLVTPTEARADVNDFTFSSLHATYLLGVNETGHSTLTTIEKLTAVFPETDQNHGIQRAIPLNYDGHSTDLTLESVEDSEGVPLPYVAEESGGFLLVTIASDDFVHGSRTYVLTYTQRDVTLTPSDGGGNQEFYWDVNGTGWAQPFDSVVAVVLMPGWIANALTGSASCYQGTAGATSECSSLERAALGNSAEFTATANAVGPGENLTVAIEFVPGTFAVRETGFFASPFGLVLLLLAALGVAVVVTTVIIRSTRWRDHPGRGIIIAEYGPPPGVTPLVAATVFGRTSKAVAAAILNLAVSGKILVLDQGEMSERETGIRSHRGTKVLQDFVLELVASDGVTSEETDLLKALFGAELIPGSHRGLSVVDAGVNRKIAKVRANVLKSTRTSGIRGSIHKALPAVLIAVATLALITGIPLAISLAQDGFGGPIPFLLAMLLIVSAFLTLVFSVNVHPLTEAGAAMRDHLRGLREFIVLAEADRLRVLQSPTGALRVPVDVTDKRVRLTLTEKVLPFAVLFGLEKEWSQELANVYAENQTQPTWYAGGPSFNAVIFAASLTTFSSAVSSSWTASSSSSSMGGSGGGGFSGGGGGGGGGGGV